MDFPRKARAAAVGLGLAPLAIPSTDIAGMVSVMIFIAACLAATFFLARNWSEVPLPLKIIHSGVGLLCVSALITATILVTTGERPNVGVADIFAIIGYLVCIVGLFMSSQARAATSKIGDVIDAAALATLPLSLMLLGGVNYLTGSAPTTERFTTAVFLGLSTIFLPLVLLLVLGSGSRSTGAKWVAGAGLIAVISDTSNLMALAFNPAIRDDLVRIFGLGFVLYAIATSHESLLEFARPGTRSQTYRWRLYLGAGVLFAIAIAWRPDTILIVGAGWLLTLTVLRLRASQITNRRLEKIGGIHGKLAANLAGEDSVQGCIESGRQACMELLDDDNNSVAIETRAHGELALIKHSNIAATEVNSETGLTKISTSRPIAAHNVVAFEQIANVVDFAAGSVEARERKATEAAEEGFRTLARTDQVTALPNQSDFEAAGDLQNKAVAIFYFADIERLKGTEGKESGEELLRLFVERAHEQFRSTDQIWRGNGPRLIIQTDIQDDGTANWLDSKRLALAAPITVASGTINPSISAGVVVVEQEPMNATSVLLRADMALEAAKEDSELSTVEFSEKLEAEVSRRWRIEAGFSSALRNPKEGGFTVHYQPIVDAKSTEVVAVEALARWTHPELGFVSPAEFIPAAERAGLVSAIDTFVLNTALHDLDTLRAVQTNLVVHVNMSPVGLTPERIREAGNAVLLARGGRDPGIVFEVIESAIGSQPLDALGEALRHVRQIGIGVSIDDFGTGESNFDRLAKLPFTQIKLANQFAQSEDKLLIESMLRTVSHLELESVVEGVETLEQYEMVRKAGADQIQGWHFARATPLADTVDYILGRQIKREEESSKADLQNTKRPQVDSLSIEID